MFPEKLAQFLYVDIETVPDQRKGAKEAARGRVTAPGNYKKQETIDAYIESHATQEWARSALDSMYGEVLMIGVTTDDTKDVHVFGRTLDKPGDEAEVLSAFWEYVKHSCSGSTVWVGHNIIGFDIPFLVHRSIINGVEPPPFTVPYGAAPWDARVRDTSFMWTQQRNRGVKLDDLAVALGLLDPKHGRITGADVWSFAEEGEFELLAAYCEEDVRLTREVFRRLLPYTS